MADLIATKDQEIQLNFLRNEYPNVEKVAHLATSKAREVADLFLHLVDLRLCETTLQALGAQLKEPPKGNDDQIYESQTLQQMVWFGTVIKYFSCFKKNARARKALSADEVFANIDPQARKGHDFFEALRDKHIAHDDNPFTQVGVLAIINRDGFDPKVPNTYLVRLSSPTLSFDQCGSLWKLVDHVIKWVEAALHQAEVELLEETRGLKAEELNKLPPFQFRAPTNEVMFETRRR